MTTEHNPVMAAHLRDIAERLTEWMNMDGGLMLPDDKPEGFDRDMAMLNRIADHLHKPEDDEQEEENQ